MTKEPIFLDEDKSTEEHAFEDWVPLPARKTPLCPECHTSLSRSGLGLVCETCDYGWGGV